MSDINQNLNGQNADIRSGDEPTRVRIINRTESTSPVRVTVTTGNADDRVSVGATVQDILGSTFVANPSPGPINGTINTGGGNDTIDVAVGGSLGGQGSKLEVNGGDGVNTVLLHNGFQDFRINKQNDGTYKLSSPDGTEVTLRNIQNIEIQSGDIHQRLPVTGFKQNQQVTRRE